MPGRPHLPAYLRLDVMPLFYDPAEMVVADLGGRGGRPRKGFETREQTVAEDRLRTRRLRKSRTLAAVHLAPWTEASELDFAYDTLASSTYMRALRRVLTDAILTIMSEYPDDSLSFVTVVPRAWTVRRFAMSKWNPRAAMRAVRAYLVKDGAPPGEWIWVTLHNEYDSGLGIFKPHLHAIGTAFYTDRLYAYVAAWDAEGKPQPRRQSRLKVKDYARAATYLWQAFVPHRPTFDNEAGKLCRTRAKHRLPSPWHEIILLWMHRHRLGDIQLKLGLSNHWAAPRVLNEKQKRRKRD